ncbi:MAG: serine/threonine-protein phosphatase [Roseburia sp.]|nr:serine/threonine-protein phosphatase [Ruminococcus sp.]MCM1155947.1 serine/threonine-protein phosphatase [Roseburia sp.]MCM1242570.1 serine/threonine-protein phosphatase [Roseburia sp.]
MVSVYWEKGPVRSVNQDSLVVLQALTLRGRVMMAAVCDGMGGMDAGEYASGYLTEELTTWFYDGLLKMIAGKKPLWVIRRSAERKIYQVESRLRRYADKRGLALGTTMSLLVLWEKKYLLWHLGDSRIYRLSGGKKNRISLLTKDHVQGNNMLTKCVGSFGFFMPDFRMGTVRKNEAFLLCSDGFWRGMQMREFGEMLSPKQMNKERCDRRLREIGQALMRRGEEDNLSAVYVLWQEKEQGGQRRKF